MFFRGFAVAEGKIGFGRFAIGKHPRQLGCRLGIERQQQHAAGGFVEPVHQPNLRQTELMGQRFGEAAFGLIAVYR